MPKVKLSVPKGAAAGDTLRAQLPNGEILEVVVPSDLPPDTPIPVFYGDENLQIDALVPKANPIPVQPVEAVPVSLEGVVLAQPTGRPIREPLLHAQEGERVVTVHYYGPFSCLGCIALFCLCWPCACLPCIVPCDRKAIYEGTDSRWYNMDGSLYRPLCCDRIDDYESY